MNEYDAYQLIVNGVKPIEKVKNKPKVKKNKEITRDEQIKLLKSEHKISCHSKTCVVPEPFENFSDLISRYDLKPEFLKCFETLQYSKPTAVQMQSIPVMFEGHNVLTLAPTGSGKTAAFLIPILHDIVQNKGEKRTSCRPHSIILSPTIELAKQTYQECICLIKELSDEDKPKIVFYCKDKVNNKYWAKMMHTADVLICTPSRMNKLITVEDGVARVTMDNLKWLVIDESDKMLEDTIDSFSDQFTDIYNVCQEFDNVRVAMFSATQSSGVWDWAKENLCDDLVYVKVGTKGAAVETIKQELNYCLDEKSKLMVMRSLLTAGKLKCPCLVFLDKADSAFHLHKLLEEQGQNRAINISLISGDLSDSKRRDVITDFREGKIHFLICTNLLARGIDFKGVETVVNYDLPKQKEEYIHRIGRCGRAGRSGTAISLWTDSDVINGLVDVMRIMKASNQPVNEELLELVKRKNKNKSWNNKGSKLLKKLKRKYQAEDGEQKDMRLTDKKRKMYFEKCVVRNRFLETSYKSLNENQQ